MTLKWKWHSDVTTKDTGTVAYARFLGILTLTNHKYFLYSFWSKNLYFLLRGDGLAFPPEVLVSAVKYIGIDKSTSTQMIEHWIKMNKAEEYETT
jgi:hypothetical protein